jgi:hypothetical protein
MKKVLILFLLAPLLLNIFLSFFLLVPLPGFNSPKLTESPETDFKWRLKDGKITIINYTGNSSDVVIPRKIQRRPVTEIGEASFKDRGLTSVVIPKGVKSIGEDAFRNNKLMSIHIPDGVTTIEAGTFANNVISDITFPNKLLRIGSSAFEDNNLYNITLPESVTYIGESAFSKTKLLSITIPKNVTEIKEFAFMTLNSSQEIIIEPVDFILLPMNVFDPPLFGILPPGKYFRYGWYDDHKWLFRYSGKLITMETYYEITLKERISDKLLGDFVYVAVKHSDTKTLRNCLSRRADVKGRMLDGQGNTPLAEIIIDINSDIWMQWSPRQNNDFYKDKYFERLTDMVTVLLEAGAVPQYWMLSYSYRFPDILKMLLEHGALTNTESSEHGSPPEDYRRPESLLLYYCNKLGEDVSRNSLISKSAALLLEYGENPNYRDPDTGRTPLISAMGESVRGTEMVELLLKHVSRPLSMEEYRLLIRMNRIKVYSEWYHDYWLGNETEWDDRRGFDTLVLEDVRKGILNPESKDGYGNDIFDYVADIGTPGLMEGLLPYLIKSGRNILTKDSAGNYTGLCYDADKAGNYEVAGVLRRWLERK